MRLAITGLGVIAPTGIGEKQFWTAARNGECGLSRITRFDTTGYPLHIGGEVRRFTAAEMIDGRLLVQTDLFTHFALAATDFALADVGTLPGADDSYSVGVVTAAYAGGVEFGQREIERLWRYGPRHVGPYQSIAWFYAASTGQISIRNGWRGPCGVMATDEAGGLDGFAQAERAIRRGAAAMLVGGTEAPLTSPYSISCQFGAGLLSDGTDSRTAYLPFTSLARGYVPAEGGAMFVVEDPAAAVDRGAQVRAVVAGHAATFGGMLAFDPGGHALQTAIRGALADAEISPEEVDVVFADGIGLHDADKSEVIAIRSVFGDRVPVTVPKTGFGRAYAGAGSLDVAAAVLALQDDFVPPTPNVTDPTTEIDLVIGRGRPVRLGTAVVLARGFGGCTSALVLRKP